MNDGIYKLEDLAREAGTSSRTVRYYVQRGLLPAPAFRGRDTVYEEGHLLRLKAIRKLQDDYLPLDAIAAELEGKSNAELERLLARGAPPPRREPAPPMKNVPVRAWKRMEIAPGLEVAIADDAAPSIRAMTGRLVEILEAMSNVKEGAK